MKNALTLVIGDKNLSSWSMRPWLVLKVSGLSFGEVLVRLDTDKTAAKIKKFSPSGGVPVLKHGNLTIWDSLAISEYIAELVPERNLWPVSSTDRALARAVTAEMHAGFSSLRAQLSMDIRLRTEVRYLSAQTIAEIERVIQLWSSALRRSSGGFLFGDFGIADAFYAPVVMRFNSYGIKLKDPKLQNYVQRVCDHPATKEWVAAALKEKPAKMSF